MCRVLGYCSRDDVSVAELIGEPGLAAFTALSCWHGDGWGMAARAGDGLRVAKAPRRASDDPEYQRLAALRLGDTGLVHLRWATPGLPVADRNSHPFVRDGFALAHNGAIHPQDALPGMLPPQWEAQLTGTTDSERYFLYILSRLGPRGGDVVAAVADTVQHIRDGFTPNSLNAILLAPDALYAISWHHPERIPVESVRKQGMAGNPAAYFNLSWWETPVLVVDRATLATDVVLL